MIRDWIILILGLTLAGGPLWTVRECRMTAHAACASSGHETVEVLVVGPTCPLCSHASDGSSGSGDEQSPEEDSPERPKHACCCSAAPVFQSLLRAPVITWRKIVSEDAVVIERRLSGRVLEVATPPPNVLL